uniref:Uncharacterized protein n=1 Tax=Cynoglossus semilaevis TaxID=244447 RepID=A0A3P8UE55_CYNSE
MVNPLLKNVHTPLNSRTSTFPFVFSSLFRLIECSLSKIKISCSSLVSALKSNPSHLRKLDLRLNNLPHSSVEVLSDLVKSPNYRLEDLKWFSEIRYYP